MKSNFQAMTIGELKKYVLKHRHDSEAFQALMKRIDAQPQDQVYGEINAEEFSILLKQHLPNYKFRSDENPTDAIKQSKNDT